MHGCTGWKLEAGYHTGSLQETTFKVRSISVLRLSSVFAGCRGVHAAECSTLSPYGFSGVHDVAVFVHRDVFVGCRLTPVPQQWGKN